MAPSPCAGKEGPDEGMSTRISSLAAAGSLRRSIRLQAPIGQGGTVTGAHRADSASDISSTDPRFQRQCVHRIGHALRS